MEKANIWDKLRKIVSFVVLIAAVIALIFFFLGAGETVVEPFRVAFSAGFDFSLFCAAIYNCLTALGVPLIMAMLGLIGVTVDH